jgi:hypothetical protein
MKRALIVCLMMFITGIIFQDSVEGQAFMRKLQDKAEDEAIDAIFGKDKASTTTETGTNSSTSDSNSPSNTKGGGLSNTSRDVVALINDAESSFGKKNFRDARYAIQQAMMGVELEIGKKILQELPENINGLPMVPEEDNVTSTGIGFAGLIIERTYRKSDQQLKVAVGNNSAWLSAANMYLASGTYSSTSTEENYKQTTFQGEKAVIQFEESSGYTLSVPFGQASILVTEGVNFDSENEFMDASAKIDIKKIKTQLGEQ